MRKKKKQLQKNEKKKTRDATFIIFHKKEGVL